MERWPEALMNSFFPSLGLTAGAFSFGPPWLADVWSALRPLKDRPNFTRIRQVYNSPIQIRLLS
jgi:hypothetical protein